MLRLLYVVLHAQFVNDATYFFFFISQVVHNSISEIIIL